MDEVTQPNPGSDEARKQGCKCAVLDNYHGKGFPWGPDGEISFWKSGDCPLHGWEDAAQEEKDESRHRDSQSVSRSHHSLE